MDIRRNGSQPSRQAPQDRFTGAARVDPLFTATEPSRMGGATVTFEPGSRTAWHCHPLGQTLIVIVGLGRVGSWGNAVKEIRPGDVVQFAPGVKHWHGASPTTAMSHIALAERHESEGVTWMDKVDDAQYQS